MAPGMYLGVLPLEQSANFRHKLNFTSLFDFYPSKIRLPVYTTVGFTDRLYNLAISSVLSTKSKAFFKSNNTVLTSELRLSQALNQ